MSAEPLRILVVDDSRADFLLTADLLEELGEDRVRVEWAPTYEEGLESVCRGEHHLGFVDYHLGAHTGIELIRAAVERGSSTPLVLLTGSETDRVAAEATAAGAAQFLAKETLGREILEETVRKVAGTAGKGDE